VDELAGLRVRAIDLGRGVRDVGAVAATAPPAAGVQLERDVNELEPDTETRAGDVEVKARSQWISPQRPKSLNAGSV
jgi:hypothetical protein